MPGNLLGTKEFAVIHHTDCGMLTFTNDDLRAKLAHAGDASDIDFLPFSDNEASVREDVESIRSNPFIPDGIPVYGYIYEGGDRPPPDRRPRQLSTSHRKYKHVTTSELVTPGAIYDTGCHQFGAVRTAIHM